MRATLLEGRIVEERVRLRVQDLLCEGRRLREIPRQELQLAGLNPSEQGFEPLDVHRLV